jgi:hypothetical protein
MYETLVGINGYSTANLARIDAVAAVQFLVSYVTNL